MTAKFEHAGITFEVSEDDCVFYGYITNTPEISATGNTIAEVKRILNIDNFTDIINF